MELPASSYLQIIILKEGFMIHVVFLVSNWWMYCKIDALLMVSRYCYVIVAEAATSLRSSAARKIESLNPYLGGIYI